MIGAQSGVDTPPSEVGSFVAPNGLVKEKLDCVLELGDVDYTCGKLSEPPNAADTTGGDD